MENVPEAQVGGFLVLDYAPPAFMSQVNTLINVISMFENHEFFE